MIQTKDYPYKEMMLSSIVLEVPREHYQRHFRTLQAKKIAENFDERLANEPKVSCRDGRYFVFDGQHTIGARKILGGGNDLPIRCKVFFGMSEEEEARLFAQQTGESSPLTAGEKLRALLFGKDPLALAFKAANDSLGLQLDFDQERGHNRVGCLKTALNAYTSIGEERYKEAMQILSDAWGGEPDSFRTENVIGVTRFVNLYHDEYDPERLVTQLRHVDPLMIYREGRATGVNLAGYKKYLYQVYRIYNGTGKKDALPMKF